MVRRYTRRGRVWIYDSPALYGDVWIAVSLVAQATARGGRLAAKVAVVDQVDESWFDAFLHGTVTADHAGDRARGPPPASSRRRLDRQHGIHCRDTRRDLPARLRRWEGCGHPAGPVRGRGCTGRDGIRCNAICPGLVLTASGRKAYEEQVIAAWQRHTPTDRLGEPEDVGHLGVYLASDESWHMTGQALVLDGGFTMHEPTWADRLDLEQG